MRELGNTVTFVGDSGDAQLLKLATNVSLAVPVLAFSEGLRLAEQGGIERDVALDVLVSSAIGSPLLETRLPLELPDEAWFNVHELLGAGRVLGFVWNVNLRHNITVCRRVSYRYMPWGSWAFQLACNRAFKPQRQPMDKSGHASPWVPLIGGSIEADKPTPLDMRQLRKSVVLHFGERVGKWKVGWYAYRKAFSGFNLDLFIDHRYFIAIDNYIG